MDTESLERLIPDPGYVLDPKQVDKYRARFFPHRNSEIFYPNEFYGHDLIYKAIMDKSPQTSLHIAIPHGIEVMNSGMYSLFLKRESVNCILFYSQLGLSIYRENRTKAIFLRATHPIYYLNEFMHQQYWLTLQLTYKKYLFFPAHSTSNWKLQDSEYDEQVIKYLKVNGYEPENTSIILTNADLQDLRHKKYFSMGYQVFTAGDALDAQFLARLILIVSAHQIILTCSVGSHVFYCSYLGKEVRWLQIFKDALPPYVSLNGQSSQNEWKESDSRIDIQSLSPESLKRISFMLLGADLPKCALEMKALESIGKRAFFFGALYRDHNRYKLVFPSVLRNIIRDMIKGIASILRNYSDLKNLDTFKK